MNCKICSNKSEKFFSSKVLNKYNIDYFLCPNCNFLQTEDPYWLEESYSSSINQNDTGYMERNYFYKKIVSIFLYLIFKGQGSFLDYAGGYGVFVRLMRDNGFNFFWDDKYTKNLFAKGFSFNYLANVDAVTSFETFEHFDDPLSEIKKLLELSDVVIFSTELYPKTMPCPEDWWYFGLDHGQHISFFSEKTLKFIAQKYGVHYLSTGSLHVFSKYKIASWKLHLSKLGRFGFDIFVRRVLGSKTISDYHLMSNMELE